MQTENHYTETDLGNISPNPKGDYQNTAKYEYLDLVAMQGGSYLCVIPVGQIITGVAPEPGKTTEHWQCVAVPGGMAPQYVDAHDKVVRLAKEVQKNTEQVAIDKQSVTQMEKDTAQLKAQTEESAKQAESSKDSAAGYARGAAEAAQRVGQAEENVRVLVNGFDAHVGSKTQEAEQAVQGAKTNAIQAIERQEASSVQEVKKQTGAYITEQKETAKQELDQKVNQFNLDVDAIKKQVVDEGAAQKKILTDTTVGEVKKVTDEGAKQKGIIDSAVQEITDDRNQIRQNKEDILAKANVIIENAKGNPVSVNDSANELFENLKIYGKSTQSGVPTPDKPAPIVSAGDKGQIEIAIFGDNLYSTGKKNSDGSEESDFIPWTGGDTLYFSFVAKTNSINGLVVANARYYDKDKRLLGSNGNAKEAGTTFSRKESYFNGNSAGSGGSNVQLKDVKFIIFEVKIYQSAEKMECKDIVVSDKDNVAFNGYQPPQTLLISDKLYGIPVNTDGNYIDENQDWICDEVNFKNMKKIQNIKKCIINGTENFTLAESNAHGINNFFLPLNDAEKSINKLMCSHFRTQSTLIENETEEGVLVANGNSLYFRIKSTRANTAEEFKKWLKTNPVTLIYALANPIETELQGEAANKFKSICSKYPSTLIQNNAEIGMELSYVTDTKNYIDRKIKEAVNSQIQSTANLLSLMPLSTQAVMIENDTNNILEHMEVEK